MREAVRVLLLVVAVVCFIVSLTYQVTVEKGPDGGELRRQTIGLQSSPWYEKTVEEGPNRYRNEFRFTMLCWSAAVMLLGVGLLWFRTVLEQDRSQPVTGESGGQP